MMKQNPTLMQFPSFSCSSHTPIVLLHDGGGTTFSYHCLGPLKRPVYGIHNPRFNSGRPWKNGIPEMAKVYAELIRSIIPKGEILLGGWSLGGLVSLEVSRLLADTKDIHIVGIVMIDSIYPCALSRGITNIVPHEPTFSHNCRPEMKLLVRRNMKQSMQMVERWVLPLWSTKVSAPEEGPISDGGSDGTSSDNSALSVGSYGSCSGTTLESTVSSDSDTSLDSRTSLYETSPSSAPRPPPTVLLRCRNYVPVISTGHNAISRVDVTRHQAMLGWEDYPYDFIRAVLDIPGHHFDLFGEEYIGSTTQQIVLACEMLEGSLFG